MKKVRHGQNPIFYFSTQSGTKCRKRNKLAFLRFAKESDLAKTNVRVTYAPDVYNEANINNYSELKKFVDECLEPELLKHIAAW